MNVHVSTVSRTVSGKHAATPQGLIPLRHFFQKGLMTEDSVYISVARIKEHIKKWIDEENKEKPLSDSLLSDKIYKKFHVRLIRRSVSFYRSSMGIPPRQNRKDPCAVSHSSVLPL